MACVTVNRRLSADNEVSTAEALQFNHWLKLASSGAVNRMDARSGPARMFNKSVIGALVKMACSTMSWIWPVMVNHELSSWRVKLEAKADNTVSAINKFSSLSPADRSRSVAMSLYKLRTLLWKPRRFSSSVSCWRIKVARAKFSRFDTKNSSSLSRLATSSAM